MELQPTPKGNRRRGPPFVRPLPTGTPAAKLRPDSPVPPPPVLKRCNAISEQDATGDLFGYLPKMDLLEAIAPEKLTDDDIWSIVNNHGSSPGSLRDPEREASRDTSRDALLSPEMLNPAYQGPSWGNINPWCR